MDNENLFEEILKELSDKVTALSEYIVVYGKSEKTDALLDEITDLSNKLKALSIKED